MVSHGACSRLLAMKVRRWLSEAMGRRHGIPRVTLSHLACWSNTESTLWMNVPEHEKCRAAPLVAWSACEEKVVIGPSR